MCGSGRRAALRATVFPRASTSLRAPKWASRRPVGHDPGMSPARVWVEAARPRTLVAMVVPVLVGTAASGVFIPRRFAATMVAGLAMQVGTNYANDYFDGVKGVDMPQRTGPRRATASGLVTPARMKQAMILAFAVASLAGLVLTLDLGPVVPAAGAVGLV